MKILAINLHYTIMFSLAVALHNFVQRITGECKKKALKMYKLRFIDSIHLLIRNSCINLKEVGMLGIHRYYLTYGRWLALI